MKLCFAGSGSIFALTKSRSETERRNNKTRENSVLISCLQNEKCIQYLKCTGTIEDNRTPVSAQ